MRAPSQFELEAKLARYRTRFRLVTRPTAYASVHTALVTFPDAQIGCRAEYLPILVGHVYGFRGFTINDDGDWVEVCAVERVLGYDFENFVTVELGERQPHALHVSFLTLNYEISVEHITWWFPELAIPVWEDEQ